MKTTIYSNGTVNNGVSEITHDTFTFQVTKNTKISKIKCSAILMDTVTNLNKSFACQVVRITNAPSNRNNALEGFTNNLNNYGLIQNPVDEIIVFSKDILEYNYNKEFYSGQYVTIQWITYFDALLVNDVDFEVVLEIDTELI